MSFPNRRETLQGLAGAWVLSVLGCGRSEQQLAADQLRAAGCEVRFKPVGQSLDAFWLEVPPGPLAADFGTLLGKLPILETLILSRTELTDDQLAHLPLLSRVSMLDLSDNQLTDASLPHLARMTSLRTLILDGNSFTDAAVPHLSELHGLRALCVRRTSLSSKSLHALRAALPGCLLEPSP